MAERTTQREVMLWAPTIGARLLRNNVGVLQDERGNYVHYGVGGNGGSDNIGWTQVLVTQEMVGRTIAVFTAVENKREDWRPPSEAAKGKDAERWRKQEAFLRAIHKAGGISCVAQSVADVAQAIESFKRDNRR